MSDEERREAIARMQEEREEQQKGQREKIYEILKSDQENRFKELEFQYAVQQGRLESALAIMDIDVDDRDRDKLRDAQRDAVEKIREQMAKIQLKVQSTALAKVLDAEKIEELMGKAFTFAQQQPRFGGGGRGGFGGGQGRGGFGGRQGRGGNNDRPGRPQRPSGDGNRNPRRDR